MVIFLSYAVQIEIREYFQMDKTSLSNLVLGAGGAKLPVMPIFNIYISQFLNFTTMASAILKLTD